jgi:hypothetical protein
VTEHGPSVSSPSEGGGARRGGGGRRGGDLARLAPIPGFARASPRGGRDARGSSAIRNTGYVACLVGTLVMLLGRFRTGAPVWLVYVGLAVIFVGWGFLALSMVRAAADARARRDGRSTSLKG